MRLGKRERAALKMRHLLTDAIQDKHALTASLAGKAGPGPIRSAWDRMDQPVGRPTRHWEFDGRGKVRKGRIIL